jgi:hypothetical protein
LFGAVFQPGASYVPAQATTFHKILPQAPQLLVQQIV